MKLLPSGLQGTTYAVQEECNLVKHHCQLLHVTEIKHLKGLLEMGLLEIEEKALDISFCILESIFKNKIL